MKNLRERWHGLTVLGVVAFAAACMTVAPAPSFADIAGGAEAVDRLRMVFRRSSEDWTRSVRGRQPSLFRSRNWRHGHEPVA